MSEASLQRAVVSFLGAALCQPAAFFAVPNNPRNAIAGRNMKSQGLRKGAPDLMIFAQGKTIGIELKTIKGTVKPEQVAMLDLLQQCGVFTAVCRSIPDVESALISAGIKLKARAA
jgi:hypothetical protein